MPTPHLIYTLSTMHFSSLRDIKFVAENYIISGEISKIIIPACIISDLRELEILLDHFNFRCIPNGKGVKIKHPSINFEKSISIGYLRSEVQRFNDRFDFEEATSLNEVINMIMGEENLDFFKLVDTHGYERYRVEIPEPIYDVIINELLRSDQLFKEEIGHLAQIFKEQSFDFEFLENLKIRDNLTFMEFVKIKRVFLCKHAVN